MKILIIRFSSIGDIVLTTPVVRTIKKQLPEVELHYATKSEYEGLVITNPYIDKVHLLTDSLSELVKQLKPESFDLVIDLHKNLRTTIIKWRLRTKYKSFSKLNWQKWLLVNLKVNQLPNTHIVDRYMEAVQDLGVKMDDAGLDYFIPDKDEVELEWLPAAFQKGFVTFAIGAKFGTKRLPIERMIELCDQINKPVILLGGKMDVEDGERIERFFQKSVESEFEKQLAQELGKKTIVFNGCGKFNLNQAASLIRQSQVVFTHDTGLMHIAAALGKTIYSIWGNTVPEFGMYPYRTSFTIFENNKVGCRPCSKIGFDQCPKGHFKCMQNITFDFYIPD
ncbi:MAG: glycosyltransferase family 9 protein [Cyclobacteriaceae bacterium]|nr:glycosyltransferase family 9 protein [Cyclobacteriaceae bacterium HetDA_MAG_MS6]